MTERQVDRRIGGQRDRKTAGQDNRRKGGQEDSEIRGQGAGGQKDRTGGTVPWLTQITINVIELPPAVKILQLIMT